MPVETLPSEQGLKHNGRDMLSVLTEAGRNTSIRTRIETRRKHQKRFWRYTPVETLPSEQGLKPTHQRRSHVRGRPVETLPSEQGLKHTGLLAGLCQSLQAGRNTSIRTRIETRTADQATHQRRRPVETLPSEQGLKPDSYTRRPSGNPRPVETLPSEQGLKRWDWGT